MRLWHKDLIPYLPRQQLLGQWRECCLIAKNIVEKGTPGHVLVNAIMDYPLSHFRAYAMLVEAECGRRGYKIRPNTFWKYFPTMNPVLLVLPAHTERIFPGWHNQRYLTQCLFNLEEKHDRGGMTDAEWYNIERNYSREIGRLYFGPLERARSGQSGGHLQPLEARVYLAADQI